MIKASVTLDKSIQRTNIQNNVRHEVKRAVAECHCKRDAHYDPKLGFVVTEVILVALMIIQTSVLLVCRNGEAKRWEPSLKYFSPWIKRNVQPRDREMCSILSLGVPRRLTSLDPSLPSTSCVILPLFSFRKACPLALLLGSSAAEAGAALIYLQCSCLVCEISGSQNPFETLARISVSTFIPAGLFSSRGLFARATPPDNGKLPPRYDYSIDLYRATNVAWRALRINLLERSC